MLSSYCFVNLPNKLIKYVNVVVISEKYMWTSFTKCMLSKHAEATSVQICSFLSAAATKRQHRKRFLHQAFTVANECTPLLEHVKRFVSLFANIVIKQNELLKATLYKFSHTNRNKNLLHDGGFFYGATNFKKITTDICQ